MDPRDTDSDDNGVLDADEDSDNDGSTNTQEITDATDPAKTCDPDPSHPQCDLDDDGIVNTDDTDDDGDGYSDTVEMNENTDPYDLSITPADFDQDGVAEIYM